MNLHNASGSFGLRKKVQATSRLPDQFDHVIRVWVIPFICVNHQSFFLREERFFVCVKEWVKYLLILEGRGVEISQRQGERWSRSVQVFSISAFPSMHLTRRSQGRLINLSKRPSPSTICIGRRVATSPPLRLDARSTTTEHSMLNSRHRGNAIHYLWLK